MKNTASPAKWWTWFDPRHRSISSWGFILNRITALGLTLYLLMHLMMLGKLAQGPSAYDDFIHLAKAPIFKFGEMFVIAGGLIHGLNGIRIALTSFGIGTKFQRTFLYAILAVAIVGIAIFGVKMFLD